MRIGKLQVRRRVWLGLGFATVATGVWWIWFRSRQPAERAEEGRKPPFVRLAGTGGGNGDKLLQEQADLYDPTPLFFPTEWNYGQGVLRDSMRRQPGEVFGRFPPSLDFGEKGIKAYGVESAVAPEQLADVLTQGNEAPFAGMGQVDVARPPLPERSSHLEVRAMDDGKIVMEESFKKLDLPKPEFVPMEYLVAISSAGVVGDPILMVGSEGEEMDENVDAFLRSYLVKTFRLGLRLNPGRYRVLVGP